MPLAEAVAELRTVPDEDFDVARDLLRLSAAGPSAGPSARSCVLAAQEVVEVHGRMMRTAAAVTTISMVSMKTSKALKPKRPGGDPDDEPDGEVTRTIIAAPRLARRRSRSRTLVTALNAVNIAFSAPESCGGQHAEPGA